MEFSEAEWQQILTNYLANKNEGIEEKTFKIQESHAYSLKCDNGLTKNVWLFDKDNIHNNSVQVINQYETEGARKNRYDVTVLVNGLPMVHVELKRRGVAIQLRLPEIRLSQRLYHGFIGLAGGWRVNCSSAMKMLLSSVIFSRVIWHWAASTY